MKRRDFVLTAVGGFAAALSRTEAKSIVKKVTTVGPAVSLAKFESASTPCHFHEVRRGKDGNVYCTCPAWRFQRKAPEDRTCKHIASLAKAIRRSA